MVYAVIAAASVGAGIVQSVTGFGSAIVLMLFVPYFYNMVAASAISSAIAMGLSTTLTWKFRKHIQWRICAFPALVYLLCSVGTINALKGIDLDALTLAFGVFLMVLSLYFMIFSKKIAFTANWKTAVICSVISGVASGLFGIGGPLMAVYFVSACKSKEEYIATGQSLFAVTNVVNFVMRIANGLFTVDLIGVTVLGFVGINVGKKFGLKILERIDPESLKKSVYLLVGLSGLLTVVRQLV